MLIEMLRSLEVLFGNYFVVMLLAGLPILILLDVLTAWISGGITGTLSSKVNSKGYLKKVIMLVSLIAFGLVDLITIGAINNFGLSTVQVGSYILGSTPIFTLVVLTWLSLGEMLSILENLERSGVNMPQFITKLLQATRKNMNDGKGIL